MGPGRIELPTSRLSGVRSNHLSYEPVSIDDFGFRIADFNNDHQAANLNPISTIRSRSDSLTYTLKKEQQKNRCLLPAVYRDDSATSAKAKLSTL
jgi:hypothetical protein